VRLATACMTRSACTRTAGSRWSLTSHSSSTPTRPGGPVLKQIPWTCASASSSDSGRPSRSPASPWPPGPLRSWSPGPLRSWSPGPPGSSGATEPCGGMHAFTSPTAGRTAGERWFPWLIRARVLRSGRRVLVAVLTLSHMPKPADAGLNPPQDTLSAPSDKIDRQAPLAREMQVLSYFPCGVSNTP
jgi:hypothetical protein